MGSKTGSFLHFQSYLYGEIFRRHFRTHYDLMDRGVASNLQSVVAKQQRAGKKIVDMATGSLLWNYLDIAQTLQKV